jgi:hypothetical protein
MPSKFRPTEAELRRGEGASWGSPQPRQDNQPAPQRLRLVGEPRLVSKGSLRAFANVELPSGLIINDVAVFVGKNGPFCGLPNKPLLDSAGTLKRDVNSRPAHVPILAWRDRDLASRFSAAVIALILAKYPTAMDDGGRQ